MLQSSLRIGAFQSSWWFSNIKVMQNATTMASIADAKINGLKLIPTNKANIEITIDETR